jgi:hypothetical protein
MFQGHSAQPSAVWAIVRDFNALPDWTGFVAESGSSRIPADKVRCIRNFRLKDGGRIRERLLALSDYEMSCLFGLESPMGVENYVATLRLIHVTDGDQTRGMVGRIRRGADREEQLAADIGRNVFGAALASLKSRFGR